MCQPEPHGITIPPLIDVYLTAFSKGMNPDTTPGDRAACAIVVGALGPAARPRSGHQGGSTLGDLIRDAIDHRLNP